MRKYTVLSAIVLKLFILQSGFIFSDEVVPQEAKSEKKTEETSDVRKYSYEGFHIGFFGGLGFSWPHATFGTLPPGTVPSNESSDHAGAFTYWFLNNDGAVIFRFSSASKKIAFKDASGKLIYLTKFTEFELGYRFQADLFFAEAGLLYGAQSGTWSIALEAGADSGSGRFPPIAKSSGYFGLFFGVGVYFPVSKNIFLQLSGRYQQGLTDVVDFPEVVAGIKHKLVPSGMDIQAGVGIRF